VCANDDETSKTTESENVFTRWIIINIIIFQDAIEQISELVIYSSLQIYAWFWKYKTLKVHCILFVLPIALFSLVI
jgi:hypothetical protein